MVLHEFESLFIHVPKTAGQSIEYFFLNLAESDWEKSAPFLLRENDNEKLGPPRLAHLTAEEYYKHHYVSRKMFDAYFKFTFVRNPWARVVSFYKFGKYNLIFTFKTFVSLILPRLLKNEYWFYKPQSEFIYSNGELMVDFLGRFESLQEDFNKICEQLNISDPTLPYVNASRNEETWRQKYYLIKNNLSFAGKFGKDKVCSKDYHDYYDQQEKEIVGELYQKDIEYFNYQF